MSTVQLPRQKFCFCPVYHPRGISEVAITLHPHSATRRDGERLAFLY